MLDICIIILLPIISNCLPPVKLIMHVGELLDIIYYIIHA